MTSNDPGTGCGPKEDMRQISVISPEMRGEPASRVLTVNITHQEQRKKKWQ